MRKHGGTGRHRCTEARGHRGTEMAGAGDGQREGRDGSKVERKVGSETGDGERDGERRQERRERNS